MHIDIFTSSRKPSLAIAVVSALFASSLMAETDLAGGSHTVTAEELSENFINSSEATADLTIDAAEAATFSGSISGNIRLVKTGAAALDITTANDFTGGVELQAGTINFTVAGSLGSGTVTISAGATLNLAAAVECANPIHLMADKSYVKFSVSSGTAEFSGDIDGESTVTSFGPYSTGKNASPRFKGSITLPNATLSNANSVKEGWMYFDGPVTVKTIAHRTDNKSGFVFSSPDNSWNYINYNVTGSNKQLTFDDGAIPPNSYITQTSGTRRNYQFNVSGQQRIAYFTHDNTGKVMTLNADSEAVVTVGSEIEATGKAQKSGNYKFSGALSLIYAPQNAESKWTVNANASTMTGSLTVSNGILSVEGTATFANVTNIVVKDGATFSCTSTGTAPLKSVKSISLASDATFELGDGIELSPEAFLVGGKAPKATGWFTGTDNENPVEGDQQTLSVLKGAGRIYIPFQGSNDEATWDGGAGASDTLVTTPANWEGDQAPEFTGGLTAEFATGGDTATFTSPVSLKAISLTATDGFTLAAGGDAASVTLSDGISVAANPGEAVVTNTLAVPVVMNAAQNWQTPANTVLQIRAPVAAESNTALTFGGEGTYEIYSTNTFTGSITLTNGLTRVYSEEGAFGAAEEGSRVTLNYTDGGRLTLFGTTIEKNFSLVKPSGINSQGGLVFASNSRNVFAGSFSAGNNWTPKPQANAEIVFADGASIGSYFRPDNTAGGVKVVFGGKPSSFGTGTRFYGGSTTFQCSSNTIDHVYIRVNTWLRLEAPDVFKDSPPLYMDSEGNNVAEVSLGGNDQSFGNLNIDNAYGYFTTPAGKPATLKFAQNTTDWTPRADVFRGPISLSKGGAATVTIASRMQTTGGDLSVTGGTLAFGESGVLASVTNIAVSGSSSILSVASRSNLPRAKEIALSLSNGGKVCIPAGMTLRVASLTIDGEPVERDDYTAATLPAAVSGDGTLRVGSPGMSVIIL